MRVQDLIIAATPDFHLCFLVYFSHVDKYACKFGMEVFKKCGKCKLPYWDDETYLVSVKNFNTTHTIVRGSNGVVKQWFKYERVCSERVL